MLVLSRNRLEAVVIRTPGGEVITVTVAEVDSRTGKVRLGFDAPRSVTVDRAEVDAAKRAEAGRR